MKKIYTLIMLFVSICMSAQTLEGDVNKDGKLTIEDVTKVIDLYLNYEEPSGPNINGHEYVDLGLPSGTLWATCNIGASSPEEYGDYFAWGETEPKSEYIGYSIDTYKWCNGSFDTMTKYCNSSYLGTVDNKTVLDPVDDTAHVNWGGDWRMPTKEEQDELCSKCTWSWTTMNGVSGRKVVGPNGNSIFLPAAGYRKGGTVDYAGLYGNYWSSSLVATISYDAFHLNFNSSYVGLDNDHRYYGLSVRAVCQ